MSDLRLADAEALADLGTYVTRARSVDADGAVRLQAHGMTLAAYVGVLSGRGLLGEGTVIGMRVMALAQAAEVDVTVALASITDRLARRDGDPDRAAVLSVPPTTVAVSWAAVAPPRAGWERVGRLATADLEAVAAQGIAEIAQGVPAGAGGHAVTALRQRVWGRPAGAVLADAGLAQAAPADAGSADTGLADAGLADAGLGDAVPADIGSADVGLTVPAGAAFAAYALGFLGGAPQVSLLRNGRWLRLSTQAGHVLVR